MKKVNTERAANVIEVYKLENEILALEKKSTGDLFTSSTEEEQFEYLEILNAKVKRAADLKIIVRGYSISV